MAAEQFQMRVERSLIAYVAGRRMVRGLRAICNIGFRERRSRNVSIHQVTDQALVKLCPPSPHALIGFRNQN